MGYKVTPIPLERKSRQESLLPGVKSLTEPHLLVRELRGEKLRCLTYEIKNTTKTSLILSEAEFAKSLSLKVPGIIAILMPTKTLNTGERTQVHVVTRAN